MQPDNITLSVDELHNATPADQIFTRFDEYNNRTVYKGPGHTSVAGNLMTMYRTFPKASGNFRGVAKSSVKFAKSYEVVGVDGLAQLTAPAIIEINFSLPVGLTTAQILAERERAIALLNSTAIMEDLNDGQEI